MLVNHLNLTLSCSLFDNSGGTQPLSKTLESNDKNIHENSEGCTILKFTYTSAKLTMWENFMLNITSAKTLTIKLAPGWSQTGQNALQKSVV